MKTVFKSINEVIHVFAQQTQEEGRSSNIFFEGKKIYSYGHHYLLAEFISNKRGDQAIMINDSGYSNSTAKHIHRVTSATRQYKQFRLTFCEDKKVLSELENLIRKLQVAKKPEIYISSAESLYYYYCQFKDWQGEKKDKKIIAAYSVFRTKDIKAYQEKKQKEIRLAKEKAAKKEKIRIKEAVNKFMNYETNYIYNSPVDYLRISKNGEHVETSQHVRVSIQAAKLLYKLIKGGKDIHGYKIEGYTVISINGTLKIGCHNIDINSVHSVGEQIINL